jgi:hypothetical protein
MPTEDVPTCAAQSTRWPRSGQPWWRFDARRLEIADEDSLKRRRAAPIRLAILRSVNAAQGFLVWSRGFGRLLEVLGWHEVDTGLKRAVDSTLHTPPTSCTPRKYRDLLEPRLLDSSAKCRRATRRVMRALLPANSFRPIGS